MTQPESESTQIETLDVATCWSLLRGQEVGRLALAAEPYPEIYPLNYTVDHGTLVFRTAPGTKLDLIAADRPVAFEVDSYEPGEHRAWSVVVKGWAKPITDHAELLDSIGLPVFPWHGAPKPNFVRIVPDEISGRRFLRAPHSTWQSRLGADPQPEG